MKDLLQYELNIIPSPYDKRDWTLETLYPRIKLPEKLDLRSELLSVRDQGPFGTCAAMAGSCMKEWQEWKDIELRVYFSPMFIYNNRTNPGEGMYMRELMNILYKMGDCKEVTFKYGTQGTPPGEAYEEAKNFVIKNYASINTIDGLKTALYDAGICVIAVPVYNYTTRMWKPRPSDFLLGGHAMAVAGYTKEGFIIRNSWGYDWGEDGYCIFPYEDWGLQWEVWTTVDKESIPEPEPEPVPEDHKWIIWLIIGLGIMGLFLLWYFLK